VGPLRHDFAEVKKEKSSGDKDKKGDKKGDAKEAEAAGAGDAHHESRQLVYKAKFAPDKEGEYIIRVSVYGRPEAKGAAGPSSARCCGVR
jgi:hypothetical protein